MKLPELKEAIENLGLLPAKVVVNDHLSIVDPKRFFESHISTLEAHPSDPNYKYEWELLLQVYTMIKEGHNNVIY